MKIKINQKKVHQALKQLQKVLGRKNNNPVLMAVYFSIKRDELILRVTDLAVGEEIKVLIPEQKDEITVLVPGKALIEAVGMFNGEETEINVSPDQMILRNGKDKVSLSVLQSDDFPKFDFKFDVADEIPVSLLKEADEKVSFAVSTDISRPQLTGIYFKFQGEILSLVGTDGFRLSLLDTKNFSNQVEGSVLIPMRAVKDVLALAEAYGVKVVKMYWEEAQNRIVWAADEFIYFTNLIEAAFPPYERIVPLDFAIELRMSREDLLLMLSKAQIFARDTSNIVRMKFGQQKVELIAKGLNGQYEGELELNSDIDGEFQIAFNIRYLIEFLGVLKSDEVWWGVNENTKPVLLAANKGDKYRYVAMPFKATD